MVLGGLALGIIAIFIPPLVVLLRAGCGANLLINIVLLFLGWIPAVLHAWFIIIDRPSARDRRRERKYDRAEHPHYGYHQPSYSHPPPYPSEPYYGQQTGYAPAPRGSY
ncbi:hypothetical protein D0863_08005 [Hortaea werneckii]|uniref:Stress response RCI peptide n=1 Tax=Hortaea werneckii TaxID=91943 RepID=A0A3M7DRY8_HORWE|nr:hypothetical protein D0863_08005 [Hortaea werneckii]